MHGTHRERPQAVVYLGDFFHVDTGPPLRPGDWDKVFPTFVRLIGGVS